MPDDIVKEAREVFAAIESDQSENIKRHTQASAFMDGEGQWNAAEKEKRAAAIPPKPSLTFNRLPQIANQIINQQRQVKYGMKALPVDEQADCEKSEIWQGLFRNIEMQSDAAAVYSDQFQDVVECGLAYIRVGMEWADEESFDQELRIRRIFNPLSVRFDMHSFEPDGSDANVAIVSEKLSRVRYKSIYGNDAPGGDGFEGQGDPDWFGEDSVRIAEYWKREFTRGKLYALVGADGKRQFATRLLPPELASGRAIPFVGRHAVTTAMLITA